MIDAGLICRLDQLERRRAAELDKAKAVAVGLPPKNIS